MPNPPTVTIAYAPAPSAPGITLRRGGVWHIRVLGALEARNGDVAVTRFVSHPIAALLARLAMQPDRMHPREELIELLWPGVEIDAGRNRLRNALSSLRRLLEPPGCPPGSVLAADRQGVRMAPDAIRCDAVEFERCVRERRLEDAREAYGGDLLPGFYEDWAQEARARIAALFERVESGLAANPGPSLRPTLEPAAAPPAAGNPAGRSASPVAMPAARPLRLLPGYLTGYFGREEERRRLAEEITTSRLVTLSGMGGAGKTRLAVEVARGVAGFDVVAFAALADCVSALQCASQLRVALQLPPGNAEPLDSVAAFLSSGRSLLVLDNFEQLVATGGLEVVEALLARVPALHLLVTSRRVLGLAGEHEFALMPLPQPDPDSDVQAVASNPSVALFVDRARSVRPDFQVTERNHAALATLCRALEGLPLAIELAASRSRAFSPKDMHAALAERFSLLARPGVRAGKQALRHDSLRAAIDWSWQLLASRHQRFLLALSVFRGGWSPASAQAVCEEPQAHALLEELAADSLLRTELDAGGSMRFGMLEMIREFLRERLDPAQAQALRRQHRAHYLAIALGEQARGARPGDETELPNFTEALRSAVDDGEHAVALTLGLALQSLWERNGIAPETLALLKRSLAVADRSDGAWAGCCTMAALLSLATGDVAAAHELADAALLQAAPASIARATALCARVRIVSESRRDAEGLPPQLDEAMAIARQAGAVDLQARCLGLMSMLTLRQKQGAERADALAAQARRLYQSIGRDREASAMLYERTMCLLEMRFFAEALAQARTFEHESVELGDRHQQLRAINQQGVIQAGMRRWADAIASYRRCAQLAWQMHNHYWLAFALWNHCRNFARLRRPEAAGLLMAFSERYWTTHFGELAPDDKRFVRQVRALVQHQVGAERLEMLWREGARLSSAEALQLALG